MKSTDVTESEKDDQRTNQQWRAVRRWVVGQRQLPPTRKLLLHAVLLRQEADGGPCWPGPRLLAEDISASVSTVYHHLKEATVNRQIRQDPSPSHKTPFLTVTLDPVADEEKELRRMWQRGTLDEPEERARWRVVDPEQGEYFETPVLGYLRHRWEREVMGMEMSSAAKGTAQAVSLLVNSKGLPFRKTNLDELACLSGYHRETVRDHLGDLEAGGWLWVRRERGRGGGIAPFLRLPKPTLEALMAG